MSFSFTVRVELSIGFVVTKIKRKWFLEVFQRLIDIIKLHYALPVLVSYFSSNIVKEGVKLVIKGVGKS